MPWEAPLTILVAAKVRIGRPFPKTHAQKLSDVTKQAYQVYPGRVVADLEAARILSLRAVIEVRQGPGKPFVLPCGNEKLELGLGDERYARLITRVDYRESATRPMTKQSAEAKWDKSRRAPTTGWSLALHESMGAHTRREGEDADPYGSKDEQ
jgi:hypothetical protein